jgi:Skp family chaperone for outer membrane proteins
MKTTLLLAAALVATAEAKPKVAILNIQNAIISTGDGKAAAAEMHRKFDPEQESLAAEQREIDELRGRNDSSLKARIEALEQSHRRRIEDARQRFETEQKRVLKDLSARFMTVVEKYAKQKHFEVVLDESDPKTAVLWRADETDITSKVIELYERGANKK